MCVSVAVSKGVLMTETAAALLFTNFEKIVQREFLASSMNNYTNQQFSTVIFTCTMSKIWKKNAC